MGRPADGDDFLETRLTDVLEEVIASAGVSYERQVYTEGRENILAWTPADPHGKAAEKLLMLEAHQDTVPVEGMTISPFDPEIREGKLFGRGACDVKGGLAAMVTAFLRLAAEPRPDMPTVLLAATVDEEFGGGGAIHMRDRWREGAPHVPDRKPDVAVIAEPTSLNVVVAHKGTLRWRLHTAGKAAHSSAPNKGDNAIYQMQKVIAVLERYAKEIIPALGSHPLVGRPSLSVGVIEGGSSVNIVPDRCTIEVDRRLLPSENPLDAFRHAVDFITAELPQDIRLTHEDPFTKSVGLNDDRNGDLAERLAAAAIQAGHRSNCIGVAFGTNAARYASHGVPAVVFGPGSIDQAHTKDEWILVSQVDAAAEILVDFSRQVFV